jgi:hypothetical protein
MTAVISSAEAVWRKFCLRFRIEDECVPLFAADQDGVVSTRMVGRGESARPVLMRSPEMESLVLRETATLVDDWQTASHRHDGLIYCVGWLHTRSFVPLYIGKAETFGKRDRNLSANIKGLRTDRSKFARWGDNYAYHVGDLSACVLPGHRDEKRAAKYQAWAQTLFSNAPSPAPRLREPVYFWAKAWDRSQVGVWEELGPTPLAFLEYLLIGVAGLVSPSLLNREGIARGSC